MPVCLAACEAPASELASSVSLLLRGSPWQGDTCGQNLSSVCGDSPGNDEAAPWQSHARVGVWDSSLSCAV